jgi:hypothetical protein
MQHMGGYEEFIQNFRSKTRKKESFGKYKREWNYGNIQTNPIEIGS